jgi:hypothetical protein
LRQNKKAEMKKTSTFFQGFYPCGICTLTVEVKMQYHGENSESGGQQ